MKVLKRIAVLILAVVIAATMAVPAVADEEYTRKDYFADVNGEVKDIVRNLISFYEEDASSFDSDYVFMLYSYVVAGMALNRVKTAETLLKIGILSSSTVFKKNDAGVAEQEKTWILVESMISEKYKAWLNDEVTDGEFTEYLAKVGGSILLNDTEKE